MQEMCTKSGVTSKDSIFNIFRIRQKHIQSGFECGNMRAAESSSWYECHVNVLAKRQTTRYDRRVQGSTRLRPVITGITTLCYEVSNNIFSRCCHGKTSFVFGERISKAKCSSFLSACLLSWLVSRYGHNHSTISPMLQSTEHARRLCELVRWQNICTTLKCRLTISRFLRKVI
jgi:hypothetical protein